jgi:hypothetical protein
MGERLIPDVAPWPGPASTQLVVARVRREVMAKTALQGPGIDFAYLPDERSAGLRWDPAPGPEQASIALTLPGAGGGAELHGCRLLPGRLRLRLPEGFRSVRLRASGPPDKPTGILVGEGGGSRVMSELLLSGKEERWGELQVPLPPGASELELRQVGSVLPCLESIAFQTGAGSD